MSSETDWRGPRWWGGSRVAEGMEWGEQVRATPSNRSSRLFVHKISGGRKGRSQGQLPGVSDLGTWEVFVRKIANAGTARLIFFKLSMFLFLCRDYSL